MMSLSNRFLLRMMSTVANTPKKFVLPQQHELSPNLLNDLQTLIFRSQNCAMLAALLKDNISFYTDKAMANTFLQLQTYNLTLDQSFYAIISPFAIEHVTSYTRNNTFALGMITHACAKLKMTDNNLWNAIFSKLYNEGLYRYLTLSQTVSILSALVENNQFMSHPLIGKLQQVCLQQKQFYAAHPQLAAIIKEATSKLGTDKNQQLLQAFP